jgi:hypothetical protein
MSPPSFPSKAPCYGTTFPPQGPLGQVPLTRRYYSVLRLPFSHLFRLRRLRPPIPPLTCCFCSSWVPGNSLMRPGSCSTGYPFRSFGWRRRKDLPGSWRTPCPHALLSDPGGTPMRIRRIASGHNLPPVLRRRFPPTAVFRGSITRPMGSLCTLRSVGYPITTQHSVLAAGMLG